MLRPVLESRAAIGTFLKLPRPEVVSLLALAGFDFVICDLEHAQIDERECREVLLAAAADGLPVIVRVAQLDRGVVNRLLEAGAAGIQLPRTRTAQDAADLCSLLRYPPDGTRSVSQAQRAAGYGAEPLPEYLAASNAAVLAVGQFETADLPERLDDVVALLDVAFIGSVDLSVDAGRPGDELAPAVRRVVERVEAAAARTGCHLGVFAPDARRAAAAVAGGYNYVAVAADVTMLRRGAADLIGDLAEGSAS